MDIRERAKLVIATLRDEKYRFTNPKLTTPLGYEHLENAVVIQMSDELALEIANVIEELLDGPKA